MTRIKVSLEKDGSFELHAKGHAGYARAGEDIVCSAVSILIFTMLESIDEKDLSFPPVVIMESGRTLVRVRPKNENRGKICGVFDVICKGFELLQKNFPKNVKFSRVGG